MKKIKVAKCCGNCAKVNWLSNNITLCESVNKIVHIYNVCKLHQYQEITVICADKNDQK